jgi:hypothetical protein
MSTETSADELDFLDFMGSVGVEQQKKVEAATFACREDQFIYSITVKDYGRLRMLCTYLGHRCSQYKMECTSGIVHCKSTYTDGKSGLHKASFNDMLRIFLEYGLLMYHMPWFVKDQPGVGVKPLDMSLTIDKLMALDDVKKVVSAHKTS